LVWWSDYRHTRRSPGGTCLLCSLAGCLPCRRSSCTGGSSRSSSGLSRTAAAGAGGSCWSRPPEAGCSTAKLQAEQAAGKAEGLAGGAGLQQLQPSKTHRAAAPGHRQEAAAPGGRQALTNICTGSACHKNRSLDVGVASGGVGACARRTPEAISIWPLHAELAPAWQNLAAMPDAHWHPHPHPHKHPAPTHLSSSPAVTCCRRRRTGAMQESCRWPAAPVSSTRRGTPPAGCWPASTRPWAPLRSQPRSC
jgi:hypothetical protein